MKRSARAALYHFVLHPHPLSLPPIWLNVDRLADREAFMID